MLFGVGYGTWALLVGSGIAFGWLNDVIDDNGNKIIQDKQDAFFDSIDYRTWLLIGGGLYFWKERNTKKTVNVRRGSRLKYAKDLYSASRF